MAGRLDKLTPWQWRLISLALLVFIGLLDFMTGYELSLSFFYLPPIALLTWYAGRRDGLSLAVLGAMIWLAADVTSGHAYSNPAIYVWNSAIRLGFFVVVAVLLSSLHEALRAEQTLARTDFSTGALNVRYFGPALHTEIARARRFGRPFTLVYIDLDNFKYVNDHFGHSTGDEVLSVVVNTLQTALREIDIVARLGGDEFAVLLPETGAEQAPRVLSRIETQLLAAMQRRAWPVTFSMGVVTFLEPPAGVDEAIGLADRAMYVVKSGSKNALHYEVAGSNRPQ